MNEMLTHIFCSVKFLHLGFKQIRSYQELNGQELNGPTMQ
jgi:hypothetical protein